MKYISLLLLPLICSCIHEEFFEIRNTFEQKLYVYSVISPQCDSIFATIQPASFNLNNLYDTSQTNKISIEGEVFISTDDMQVELKQSKENPVLFACSQKAFPVKPGKKYKLKAKISGFDTIYAETTIPETLIRWENPVFPKREIIKRMSNFFKAFIFEADVKKTDNIYFEKIFYLEMYTHATKQFDSLGNFYPIIGNTDTTFIKSSTNTFFNFVNNVQINEKPEHLHVKHIVTDKVTNEFDDFFRVPSYKTLAITYLVFKMDDNYSDYIQLQKQYKDPPWTEAMPIEPQIDYVLPSFSNVEGGYGLFGSYVYDSIHYDLRNYQDFHENN